MIIEKRYNDAVVNILVGVHNSCRDPSYARKFLYYPGFDSQIEKLALALTDSCDIDPAIPLTNNTLIIASEMFQVGGHSRVIADIARAVPSPIIVLTDMLWNSRRTPDNLNWLLEEFSDFPVIPLLQTTPWEKCRALFNLTQRFQPKNILYFNHHEDPIPFIGTLGHTASKKTLVHHCDHNPSLGNTVSGVYHVDFTDETAQACSSHLNRTTSILPLYVPDEAQKQFDYHVGQTISVVTSGADHKYARTGEFALQEIVLAALSSIGGNFYHIGNLAEEWIEEIKRYLTENQIDPTRYIPVGNVKSVWTALLKLDAHMYLASAPVGGGRAAIEAQGCGYPVVFLPVKDQGTAIAVDSIYANKQLAWNNLTELQNLLKTVTPRLPELSVAARKMYEKSFSKAAFATAVAGILS